MMLPESEADKVALGMAYELMRRFEGDFTMQSIGVTPEQWYEIQQHAAATGGRWWWAKCVMYGYMPHPDSREAAINRLAFEVRCIQRAIYRALPWWLRRFIRRRAPWR